jgi:hypothetical protein
VPERQFSWPDLGPEDSPPGGIWGNEETYQQHVQMGLAPPRAGHVFGGDVRTMFRTPSPSPRLPSPDEEDSDEDLDDEIKEDADVNMVDADDKVKLELRNGASRY